MGTSVQPTENSHTAANKQNLEIFSLIWLNASENVKDIRDTEQKLRSIINCLHKFYDVKQCKKYIEEQSEKDRLVMIVSGRMGREIVPYIHKLRHVLSIYVYCKDKKFNEQWTCKFAKVKAVVIEPDELVNRIKADHKIHEKLEEPLAIDVYTTGSDAGKSTTGINGKFLFSQLLINCLLRLKSTEEDKKELINLCKTQYEGNSTELNNLREFKESYSSDNALWWYTRESFFYKTLNAALRKEDIHMIYLFRAFISDIRRQLTNYQAKQSLQVYRGQMISNDELEILKQTLHQFISVNSFFSTSTNRQKACSFLHPAADKLKQSVLFEIYADPKIVITKPFADISAYSVFKNESEVLFMLGSLFRLNSIKFSNDDKVWIIQMTLCSENEHDLKQVFTSMEQQLGWGETTLQTFGKVLAEMGKFHLAEKYFLRLLEKLPSNSPLLPNLYEDLAKLASQSKNYDKSMEWRQKALTLKIPNPLITSPDINKISTSIGKFAVIKSAIFDTSTLYEASYIVSTINDKATD